jgi:hypothetical protein
VFPGLALNAGSKIKKKQTNRKKKQVNRLGFSMQEETPHIQQLHPQQS